ncbi:uncharacterized protein FSUBG_2197 [Fusarium subglutinans]|uniref:Uncharacterized protein n=1 Tax=Gibberella subglutinans TaxID=42677 RepID=A0A8H5Q8Y2_GIBSU|nr:uncharacterized protein FSUBG_2197 [Fusarium subglutinans]KAF5611366.1 hypothetical protein FSUBG_2197 [Fusarium subglutinans]
MNMGAQPENESFEMSNRPVSPLSVVTEEDIPESVDTSSAGTPKPEDTSHDAQSANDGLLAPSREGKIAEEAASLHADCPLKRHVLYSLITIAFIGSASLICSCWLIAYIQVKTDRSYIAAVIVGGKLSSTEAKLIDAAFSILVAPAVVAVANWHMFKLARLSAVNEHSGRNSAVSMKVLVEVAGTDWGSFSPLKFWTFVRSKRPRVVCLGMIAVLSALSFSLLGNVVAYQQAGVDTSTQVLEYLHDTHSVLPRGSNPIPLDDQSIRQQVSARLQDRLSRLQQGMLEPSTTGLVSVNVSDQSRSSLSPAVMQLYHAPVYRLKMFCSPSHLQGVSIMLPDRSNPRLSFVLEETASVFGSESTTYEASLGTDQGVISDIVLNEVRATYPLIAFNETALWIGVMDSGGDDGQLVTTKRWGSLIPFAKGLPGTEEPDGRQTNYSLTFSGLTCRLNRSTRWADVKVNGSDWSMIENTLVDEKLDTGHDMPVLSLTSSLDTFDDARDGRPPGLGGHLLRAALRVAIERGRRSWDLETLADAFLWYEIEARQVLLDNDQTVRAERYQVQSNIDEYAMTFVPWILISGLGTLGAACALTIGLTLDSWKVYSLRSGRMLDSIRLTADVGVALDKQVFEECSTWHATRLNKCADEARFQYEPDARLDSATGLYTLGIRLRQISRPHD